jgi:RNA polymerase sigma-70 factor, ECF subfamily
MTELSAAVVPPPESPAPSPDERLRAMFEHDYAFIWRLLRRSGLLPQLADEAVQEVFLIASQKLASIAIGSERSFLFGTALRVASTLRRSAAYRREHTARDRDLAEETHLDEVQMSADELIDRKRAIETVDAVVSELADDVRHVFILFELEGCSTEEIAKLMNIPSGTVASRLRRAREDFQSKVSRRPHARPQARKDRSAQ